MKKNIASISKHLVEHPHDKVWLTDEVYVKNTYASEYKKDQLVVTEAGEDLTAAIKSSPIEVRKFAHKDEFVLVSQAPVKDLGWIIKLFEAVSIVTQAAEPKDVKVDDIETVDDTPIDLSNIPF